MSACGDELQFVKALTDTLCSIKGGKVNPLYKLDFGKEFLTKNKVMDLGSWDNEGISYAMKNKIFTSVCSMFETSRYIVIAPLIEPGEGYYWIDKKNGSGFRIASSYYIDKEIKKVLDGTAIKQIKASTEKELISCFDDSLTIQAFKDQIGANKDNTMLPESVVSAIGQFDPEGNPFLIIYSH